MGNILIAVPSDQPGGLEAALGAHFGHCELYTLVEIAGGEIIDVRTLPAMPHQQGGCMAPVNHLAQNGVNVLLAGGMGMRPLLGFSQVGIRVYQAGGAGAVGQAVQAYLQDGLRPFTPECTCGGGQAGL